MRTRQAMRFQVVPHTSEPGVQVVEVWIEDEFVATITPGDAPNGAIRVTSKYLAGPVAILDDLAPVTVVEAEFVGVP